MRLGPWSWLSQLTIWFQLVRIWVTTRVLILNDRDRQPSRTTCTKPG